MASPMSMYLYVHTAILREVADLEVIAKEVNRDDSDEIGELAARIDLFRTLVKRHEESEEQVLFPAMNDRFRFVAETYEYDHDDFEHHIFDDLNRALAGLHRTSTNGGRSDHAELLYRQCVALHEHMRLHIAKENELLIPKLEAEFDLDEQAQLAGAMAGVFDPPLLAKAVNFTFGWHSASDQEGIVRFLRHILPDDPFNGLTNYLKAENPEAWPEMERRIPELAPG